MNATRRTVLAASALSVLLVRPAGATPASMAAAVLAFTGGATARKGRVALEIPALVENGNSVPLKVIVESPMTAEDSVEAIAVFNERNPQPNVAVFRFTPRSGRAEISTRIRLGDSQTIIAVARLSDGSFWRDQAELVVTLPACAES
jgi:sulfur-oxidizing protein SoxY